MRKRRQLQTHPHLSVDPHLSKTLDATIAKMRSAARSPVVGWRLVSESGLEARRRESPRGGNGDVGSIKSEDHQFFGFRLVLRTAVVHCFESRKLGLLEYAEDLRPAIGLPPLEPGLCVAGGGSPVWCSSGDNFCAFGFSQVGVRRSILRQLSVVSLGGPGPAATEPPFRDRRRSRCSFCRSDMWTAARLRLRIAGSGARAEPRL